MRLIVLSTQNAECSWVETFPKSISSSTMRSRVAWMARLRSFFSEKVLAIWQVRGLPKMFLVVLGSFAGN